MKKLQLFLVLGIISMIFVACGANNPTTSSNTTQANTTISPKVTAYQGAVHQTVLTAGAIDLLLLPSNPANITKKQIDILTYYQQDIEQGAYDEDYDIPFLPITRTPNHFMDPQHGNAPLSDPPMSPTNYNPISAEYWMMAGDSSMYSTASLEYIKYITMHKVASGDPELQKIMKKLGHVLHMFQDMTSVPHTRNDSPPPFV